MQVLACSVSLSSFYLSLLPDSISSPNFLGGMPPDPPSKSMLHMLSVLHTLQLRSYIGSSMYTLLARLFLCVIPLNFSCFCLPLAPSAPLLCCLDLPLQWLPSCKKLIIIVSNISVPRVTE